MMGSAQLEPFTLEPLESAASAAQLPSTLKLEVAERLEAHRRRKASAPPSHAAPMPRKLSALPARRASVAASIAERYAQTPSYRAVLAEQAQRAIEEAAAAADVAARSARAVAEVQGNLLAELELWNAPQEFTAETAQTVSADLPQTAARVRVPMPEESGPERLAEHGTAGLTVRLYEDRLHLPAPPDRCSVRADSGHHGDSDEALALDEEILFRQSPVFEDVARYAAEPPLPLAANLLEFPRQLIAARKARPRIAEGPLLDEVAPRAPQLRIFEVETEQFAAQPEQAPELPLVQSFIYLDAQPAARARAESSAHTAAALVPETAAISRRLFALGVDGVVVGSAVAAFMMTASKIAGSHPVSLQAAITAGIALIAFWMIYQVLFFTLSEHTPGMRCARIGLCTLSDQNPTRKAMRRRILAQWIAILPLGIGVLWAFLDDDRLGWHDRISQMYQRAY